MQNCIATDLQLHKIYIQDYASLSFLLHMVHYTYLQPNMEVASKVRGTGCEQVGQSMV